MAGRLLLHTVWFAFLCRRAFSGVAGDSWTVPPREGAPHACGECAQHMKPRERGPTCSRQRRSYQQAADTGLPADVFELFMGLKCIQLRTLVQPMKLTFVGFAGVARNGHS